MAVTGLILIAFLLMHMYGNLKMFAGAEAFNHYAHWLKSDILYPIVPRGWFIWIFRFTLLIALILHVASAASLTLTDRRAHNANYVTTKRKAQTYSARTMRWGGVILLTGLIFHLLQFTTKTIQTGFTADTEPYAMFVASFSHWWLVLGYAVWIVTVVMHVRHGFWSAFTTLGANVSAKSRQVLNVLAIFVAALLLVGFLLPPVAVLIGWVN